MSSESWTVQSSQSLFEVRRIRAAQRGFRSNHHLSRNDGKCCKVAEHWSVAGSDCSWKHVAIWRTERASPTQESELFSRTDWSPLGDFSSDSVPRQLSLRVSHIWNLRLDGPPSTTHRSVERVALSPHTCLLAFFDDQFSN